MCECKSLAEEEEQQQEEEEEQQQQQQEEEEEERPTTVSCNKNNTHLCSSCHGAFSAPPYL